MQGHQSNSRWISKASNGSQLTEFCKNISKKLLDSLWSSVWPYLNSINYLAHSFSFDPSCRTIEFCWKQFGRHKHYACKNYLSIHSKKLIIITYNCLLFTNIFSISQSLPIHICSVLVGVSLLDAEITADIPVKTSISSLPLMHPF